jgi:predicted unusual protein kinase regulating ubiquinone biosynthesis (AarF/ABC1/UbiB family)
MNLFHLFGSIIKYNLPFTNKSVCINDIKQQFVEGGGVWQKFAQVLSGQGEIISYDLADELKSMCFDCPAHDDAYSARIIKDAFGDKYDTKRMKMIGSGTISQVYKIYEKDKDYAVAIKVMHPNIKKEIKTACELYNNIKDSYLFPGQLKTITKLFFLGLKEQLDMRREFKNGKLVNAIFNGDLIVTPKMIECSKKCIVMSYENSELACKAVPTEENKHTLMKMCNLSAIAFIKMFYYRIGHLDLHQGNYGYRIANGEFQLVIYDFGQCVVLNNTLESRIAWIESFFTKNYKLWLQNTCPDHAETIFSSCYRPKESFEQNSERTASNILMNNYQLDDNTLNICVGCIKTGQTNNMVVQLETFKDMEQYGNAKIYKNGYEHYINKHFPYPELDDMKQLFIMFDKKLKK